MLLLIMIPFWTSGLIRLYGWIIVFRSNGVLDKILMGLHLTDRPLKLLYTYPAVVVGMVYALLPFMSWQCIPVRRNWIILWWKPPGIWEHPHGKRFGQSASG